MSNSNINWTPSTPVMSRPPTPAPEAVPFPYATTSRYVCGFMFSPDLQQVALIRKTKPKWQAGKLNGVGGSIEPNESDLDAMVREFLEETAELTDPNFWRHYLTMEGINDDGAPFGVEFFCTTGDLQMLVSATEEQIETLPLWQIFPGRKDMIENLPWLIGMALDHLQDGRPSYATVFYETAKGAK